MAAEAEMEEKVREIFLYFIISFFNASFHAKKHIMLFKTHLDNFSFRTSAAQ